MRSDISIHSGDIGKKTKIFFLRFVSFFYDSITDKPWRCASHTFGFKMSMENPKTAPSFTRIYFSTIFKVYPRPLSWIYKKIKFRMQISGKQWQLRQKKNKTKIFFAFFLVLLLVHLFNILFGTYIQTLDFYI